MGYQWLGLMTNSSRTFHTVCDVCLRDVPGILREDDGRVYLCKLCDVHGERRVLMSRNGKAYLTFDRHYHAVFPPDEPPPPTVDTCFFITNRCNLGCWYCAVEANAYDYFNDYETARFAADLVTYSGAKVSLIGGEPFSHCRVFDFVRLIEQSGKTAVVFTNGLALADESVVQRLVEVSRRRCEVRITLEGFSPQDYAHLPAPRVRERKLAALEHLAKHRVPSTIGHTIEPSEQHDREGLRTHLRQLIAYAMSHEFVRGVTFQGTAALGGMRHATADDVWSVDQVMDEIVAAIPFSVARRDVYLTQRLVHLVAKLFGLPMCEYVQTAVLFRVGERWVGLDHFFDCDKLERRLDMRLEEWSTTSRKLLRALAADMVACARASRVPSLAWFGLQLLPVFFNRYDFASIPRSILPLVSISVCDRYNLDSHVARRCEKMVHLQVGERAVTQSCSDMMIRQLRERTVLDATQRGNGSAEEELATRVRSRLLAEGDPVQR